MVRHIDSTKNPACQYAVNRGWCEAERIIRRALEARPRWRPEARASPRGAPGIDRGRLRLTRAGDK